MNKIDKRKTYYLVVDVETADKTESPLVYDLGLAVCDRYGNIYETKSILITNIFFDEREKMQSAYYSVKIPNYYRGLYDNKWIVRNLFESKQIVNSIIAKYNIKMVLAYNAYFDTHALDNTQRYVTDNKYKYFLPYGIKVGCIWSMACQTICSQKSYLNWAIDNGYVSPYGNIQTSAEVVYKYLQGNQDFTEEHTGLEDVKIETKIFAQCMRQHKKMNKSINRWCWQIPTQKARSLQLV